VNRREIVNLLRTCSVCLYNYIDGTKYIYFKHRMVVHMTWRFSGPFVAHGCAIVDSNDRLLWFQNFSGGPINARGGDEINVDFGSVHVDNMFIRDLMADFGEGRRLATKYTNIKSLKPLKWTEIGF
jgi:hypothetical protein